MSDLKEGSPAPDFKLEANNGKTVALADLRGKRVVLYFYPKDDTPGCTVEACGFRDSFTKFKRQNTVVLGVSPDDVKKHQKFIDKYDLPFLLLSDVDKKVCNAYGVWVEKNLYGRKYMGVARTTFLINEKGKINRIFSKVKPRGHDMEVLNTIESA